MEVIRVGDQLSLIFEYMQGSVYDLLMESKNESKTGLSEADVRSIVF